MKVLLTGASGFVGSHVLDRLVSQEIETAILLRQGSSTRFIHSHLPRAEVRAGSIDDADSLRDALHGVTHVIHCAGITKALKEEDFLRVNQAGVRRLVEAVNAFGGRIQRLVHVSSLAAAGPAPPEKPAREEDPPRPVSAYGRSKLAGEREIAEHCRVPYVLLRPPAVYGPRDVEFLRVFKAARFHLHFKPLGGLRAFSLAYVRDLAAGVVAAATHPAADGKTYFLGSPEIVTPDTMGRAVARQMATWSIGLPAPVALAWPLCLFQEGLGRLTGRPSVLGTQKYAELRAAGWVCDPGRIQAELGVQCGTSLQAGLGETAAWYRREGWL